MNKFLIVERIENSGVSYLLYIVCTNKNMTAVLNEIVKQSLDTQNEMAFFWGKTPPKVSYHIFDAEDTQMTVGQLITEIDKESENEKKYEQKSN